MESDPLFLLLPGSNYGAERLVDASFEDAMRSFTGTT